MTDPGKFNPKRKRRKAVAKQKRSNERLKNHLKIKQAIRRSKDN